jgi:hypothetical protein
MAGTIITDRIESDSSYASRVEIASPVLVTNTFGIKSTGGTGNFNFVGANTNTDRTFTLPDIAGDILTSASDLAAAQLTGRVSAANAPLGSVIQVVQGETTTGVTSSSTTYVDTGLSATITPSSVSSKILVVIHQNGAQKNNIGTETNMDMKLFRGATEISHLARGTLYKNQTILDIGQTISISYLDSPSTILAITYKTQFARIDGTGTVTLQGGSPAPKSTITLMEIAA